MPFLQAINRRVDHTDWLRPFVRQPAPLLLLPAATVGAQWSLAALIAICCLAMSWLARKNASESARYQLVKWLMERIESEAQIRARNEPTDYFPGSRPEDIWTNGEPVLVSVIVVPTLNVPKAAPVDKDRTIIAFHSRPDQMLGNPYRYYPLLHEFGHSRQASYARHCICVAQFLRLDLHRRFGDGVREIRYILAASAASCRVLSCWATMFCYEEETLQAEVAADHFALEATRDLAQAAFSEEPVETIETMLGRSPTTLPCKPSTKACRSVFRKSAVTFSAECALTLD